MLLSVFPFNLAQVIKKVQKALWPPTGICMNLWSAIFSTISACSMAHLAATVLRLAKAWAPHALQPKVFSLPSFLAYLENCWRFFFIYFWGVWGIVSRHLLHRCQNCCCWLSCCVVVICTSHWHAFSALQRGLLLVIIQFPAVMFMLHEAYVCTADELPGNAEFLRVYHHHSRL